MHAPISAVVPARIQRLPATQAVPVQQRLLLAAGATILSGAIAAEAPASLLLWNNAAGGLASTAGNWSPAQIPDSADDLTFNLVAAYPVTFNVNSTQSDSHTYKLGTVTLSNASTHFIGPSGLRVGDVNGDNATMTLTTGTLDVGGVAIIGDDAGSIGTLNVNDDDADLIVSAGADLFIGNNGAATLNITGGGLVQVADQVIGGSNASSTSNLTVSGTTNLVPVVRSTLIALGAASQSRLGQGGDATVNISNGALAAFDGDVVIANGSASTSTLTVAGVGGLLAINATLDVAGDLLLGRNTSIGAAAGSATVNINAAGDLLVGETLLVAGDPDGGTATLHVADFGEIVATSLDIGPGSTLDFDGGTIDIDGGTLAYSNTAVAFNVGGVDHPVLTMISGASANLSTVFNARSLVVGGGAGVTLGDFDVRSGSDLTIGGFGDVMIGDLAGDDGSMIINGAGSTMTLLANSDLFVGRNGIGRFEAELDGAVVGPRLFIGSEVGSQGLALFENPDTTAEFTNVFVGGDLAAGGGDGQLTVNAQAVMDADNITIWPTGRVEVAQSAVLNVGNLITVRGEMELEDGATIHAGHVLVTSAGAITGPNDIAGAATLDSSIDMQAGSTLTLVDGDLAVGDPDEILGFLAEDGSVIAVGAHTLTLHDLDRAQVDDITINGGHIIAPNGLEIVTPGQDGRLDGTGTITGQVFLESGGSVITATTAAGITINGQFRNNSGNIDGTKYTFNNNPNIPLDSGWTGAGAINAQVVFNAGTEINALANMTMGDGSNFGVTFNAGSELHADTRNVTLVDANGVGLPSIADMDNGSIICAQSLVVNNGRVLRGRGVVQTPLLTIFGNVRPGDFDAPGMGQLTVTGDLDIGVNANVFIHVGGTPPTEQFDVIAAGGAVDLNGKLHVNMLNGFSPALGTTYAVLGGSSLTGVFNQLLLERPGPGKNWKVVYNAATDSVVLVVTNCVADVTHDGAIDVNDLLAVITTWGPCPDCPTTHCAADVVANCQVDVNDLLSVITTWGVCP